MEAFKFTATKKFCLIPIGKVSFSFDRKTKITDRYLINVGEMNIKTETDVDITHDQYYALRKEMKKAKTDLLTDGHDFFTTRGNKITQISHPLFYRIKNENEEVFKKFCYSDEIPVKEL